MNTFAMILAVILFLMSLLLTLAQPVVGIIGMVIAVLFFLWARKRKKDEKAKKEEEAARKAAQPPLKVVLPTPTVTVKGVGAPPPSNIPFRKYKKAMTVKLTGVTFKCENDEDETRQEVLAGMSDKDAVEIEATEYKGKPAYLVVDPGSGLDIGTLPKEVAEEYPDEEIEGYLTGLDSFIPDDKDEEVYFSKVRIYILEDA